MTQREKNWREKNPRRRRVRPPKKRRAPKIVPRVCRLCDKPIRWTDDYVDGAHVRCARTAVAIEAAVEEVVGV